MYESFASKTIFITRPVGNVKDHEEYIRIVNTPDEMAKAANYLLDHSEEREALAEEAFQLWKDNYTFESIVNLYENLLEGLYSESQ